MKENVLTDYFDSHPGLADLLESINSTETGGITVSGLTGSSKALAVSKIFRETQLMHVVIIPEKEDAAYFYNDLVALLGDDSVFFFPSTYKRSVLYEQTEPANIVLRTEVLNHLSSGRRKGIIVTYPESVMEKVISRRNLKKNTLRIAKGDKLSLEFIEEMLHEYNFERVDFVYEPGQYSIRGSITDVFSFSSDLPYRIDFFSDEVETIRTFNTEDQLSIKTQDSIQIIPNIQDISVEEISDSFTDFLPPSAIIWTDEAAFMKEKINSIHEQTLQREGAGQLSGRKDLVMTGSRFFEECRNFRIIEFGRQSLFGAAGK